MNLNAVQSESRNPADRLLSFERVRNVVNRHSSELPVNGTDHLQSNNNTTLNSQELAHNYLRAEPETTRSIRQKRTLYGVHENLAIAEVEKEH